MNYIHHQGSEVELSDLRLIPYTYGHVLTTCGTVCDMCVVMIFVQREWEEELLRRADLLRRKKDLEELTKIKNVATRQPVSSATTPAKQQKSKVGYHNILTELYFIVLQFIGDISTFYFMPTNSFVFCLLYASIHQRGADICSKAQDCKVPTESGV